MEAERETDKAQGTVKRCGLKNGWRKSWALRHMPSSAYTTAAGQVIAARLIYMCVRTCVCVCVCKYMYVCIYLYICMCVCVCVCVCIATRHSQQVDSANTSGALQHVSTAATRCKVVTYSAREPEIGCSRERARECACACAKLSTRNPKP